MTQSWIYRDFLRPLEPVQGVKVTHAIHVKTWRIETALGVVVVTLNWRSGEMIASLL